MEPISEMLTHVLSIGANAVLKGTVSLAVKDAYQNLKTHITQKFPKVNIEQLEEKPDSKAHQAVVAKDLADAQAEQDPALLKKAQTLLSAIESSPQDIANLIGVELDDIKATNLRLHDIISSGDGVKVKNSEFSDDVKISSIPEGTKTKKALDAVSEASPRAARIDFDNVHATGNAPIHVDNRTILMVGGAVVALALIALFAFNRLYVPEHTRLAGELGVTQVTLKRFFKIQEEQRVPATNLDTTLREMAQNFKDLDKRLASFQSDDPEVKKLKEQARQALNNNNDFTKAEALLSDAYQRDIAAAKATQAHAGKKLISAAATAAEQGTLKEIQLAYTEAAAYYKKAAETIPPEEQTKRAEYLNDWGMMAYQGQHYEQALEPLVEALAVTERTLGPEHPHTVTSLNNLALLYHAQGDYDQAKPLLQRALDIREKTLGLEHPNTATSLDNLALLYHAQSDYDQAQPLLQRALDINEKTLGPEHPDTASSLNSLALLYDRQYNYERALPLFQRALDINDKALGPEHPDAVDSLHKLAKLYNRQGDYERAKRLLQRALNITEKTLGPEHPDAVDSLHKLAKLYKRQGDYERAESLYLRALDISEKTRGPEHPDTAYSLTVLAFLYHDHGDYERAESLYLRALDINEKTLGPEHSTTANSLQILTFFYREHGDYEGEQRLLQRALDTREKTLGPEHPATVDTLNSLAMLYKTQGDYERAQPLLQRALDITEKALGPEHPDTKRVRENYAVTLQNLDVKLKD